MVTTDEFVGALIGFAIVNIPYVAFQVWKIRKDTSERLRYEYWRHVQEIYRSPEVRAHLMKQYDVPETAPQKNALELGRISDRLNRR